ncbi:MAG: hypothetical protein E4H28_03925 [Gemmatimonadales bacterium]|nr:MAG: hypothetical protein E4H28_03925 [Gemmatimonadales bacterium]
MRRKRVLPACTLAVLCSLHSGAAQEAPSTTISSFRGLNWGIDAEVVLEALGEPEEDVVLDGGLRMLAFRDSLVGRPSVVLFGILPDDGLVKGQEVVNALEGRECIDQVRRIHTFVDLQYPLIRPTEQAKNNTAGMICEAGKQGSGYWYRQWIDESTGSVISVRLESGSDQISLTYESLRFREWVGVPGDVVPEEAADAEEAIGQTP